jgi:hypothetical protein
MVEITRFEFTLSENCLDPNSPVKHVLLVGFPNQAEAQKKIEKLFPDMQVGDVVNLNETHYKKGD